METRLGHLHPMKNAVWRKNTVKLVRKVCEHLEKQVVDPTKVIIYCLRTCAQTVLRHLDGRARLAEIDGILKRNSPWNK